MKNILLIVFVVVAINISYAQKSEVYKISNVKGTGYDTDMTKAREKAVNDAKINALRESGIVENINSYSDMFKSESEENYQELFVSQVFTEMNGAVRQVEIVLENKDFSLGDNIKIDVWINCEVVKYSTVSDPFFVVNIDGIKPFYYAGDLLSFSVSPDIDCWMYVFCIPQNEEESYFLFPNEWEPAYVFKGGQTYQFPQRVDFELSVNGTNVQSDRLIFVFTKQKYPWIGKITYKNIFDWIFNIPPDQRTISSISMSIAPKN
jgi:hypothetical protein